MFTRSHMRTACAALAMLSAAILSGCSTTSQSGHSATPTPVFVAKPAAPPVLNLCADPIRPPDAIASKPGYVQMTVLATDQSGHPITGLTKSDFVAWTGKHDLPIVFFRGDRTAAPVSVVVVIDMSGSMATKLVAPPSQLPSIRAKIDAVVGTIDRCDELALISAGGAPLEKVPPPKIALVEAGRAIVINGTAASREITIIEPFTTDHFSAMKNLYKYTAYGQTLIYDAIDEAARMLSASHYRRRAIILVSDGMDNTSELTLKQTIAAARHRGVRIFAVGIGNPLPPGWSSAPQPALAGPFGIANTTSPGSLNKTNLQKLADGTGGALFIAQDVSKDDGASLAAALRKIIDALGTGYTIGVLAPSHEGSEALLPSVGIVKNSNAIVHAYAEPPAQPHPAAIRHLAAAAARS